MVILLNGAFGIGKTTVASLVAKRLPSTALFDPERLGFVLQRARRLARRPVDDFQDLGLWRRLFVLGVRVAARARRNVIVPMAFSSLPYLREVRDGIATFEPHVIQLCLVAPVDVVHQRLATRNAHTRQHDLSWQYRRAAECCLAHRDAAFGEHVPTAGRTPEQVAEQVLAHIERAQPRSGKRM